MRSSTRTVYWCDFCGRRYLVGTACAKHELRCTLNPRRRCRWSMSERNVPHETTRSLPQLVAQYRRLGKLTRDHLARLDDDVEHCPACQLTVLTLSGKLDSAHMLGWDYVEAVNRWRGLEREEYDHREQMAIQGRWL